MGEEQSTRRRPSEATKTQKKMKRGGESCCERGVDEICVCVFVCLIEKYQYSAAKERPEKSKRGFRRNEEENDDR